MERQEEVRPSPNTGHEGEFRLTEGPAWMPDSVAGMQEFPGYGIPLRVGKRQCGGRAGASGSVAPVPSVVFMRFFLFQKPFPVLGADFLQGRPALVAVQFLEPEGMVFLRVA